VLMDFPALIAKYDMTIKGVLHCGAHLAEEAPLYHAADVGDVWWVEANPAVIPKIVTRLARYPGQQVIEALLWSHDGETKTLHRSNYDGMSSSLLPFGTHPQFSPDTVFEDDLELVTVTIDTLVERYSIVANLLVMDLQGVEGFVLQGATRFLPSVDYILTEVNNEEVYLGCSQVADLFAALPDFEPVETYWVPRQGWGDCCLVRQRR
jgi:FkbM family methyltransferase